MAQEVVLLKRIKACAEEFASIVKGVNPEQITLEIIKAIGFENVDLNDGVKPAPDEKAISIGPRQSFEPLSVE